MNNITITTDDNFISLKIEPVKQFSFLLKTEGGSAEGYCDLSDDEYEVFKNVFQRIADNVVQDTNPSGEYEKALDNHFPGIQDSLDKLTIRDTNSKE